MFINEIKGKGCFIFHKQYAISIFINNEQFKMKCFMCTKSFSSVKCFFL